jgi:hypothetical protein
VLGVACCRFIHRSQTCHRTLAEDTVSERLLDIDQERR